VTRLTQHHEHYVPDATADGALGEIARRYRVALNAYFRRRVTPPHECEDLTQEVLLRLAQRAGGGDIRAVQPYVFQTAANVLTDHLRRRATRGWGRTETYREDVHAQPDHSPENALLERETLSRLSAAIETLPERARHAFVLFRFEGMRQSDIAAHMGISLSAVEKHIRLGMIRLAMAMAD
jgi:RNA polymerase sigma-19 factor, ECF subfamily